MLNAALIALFVLLYPFVALLGLELVDAGINLVGLAVGRLRRLPERAQRALPFWTLLLVWIAAARLPEPSPRAPLAADVAWMAVGLTVPFLLAALLLWLARRWSGRGAMMVLALWLAMVPIAYGVMLAVQRDQTLQAAAAPPVFLFASMFAYNTLSFGRRFAEGDSRVMPRDGRIPVYFGTILLLVSCALLRMNVRSLETGRIDRLMHDVVNALFYTGILAGGPVYLAWTAFKRPERLIGEDPA